MAGLGLFPRRRVVWAGIVWALGACQTPPPPPPQDLEEAARVIREMMSPRKLDDAGFMEAYPDPKPSDFVGFISSSSAAGLWPPRVGSPFTDETELERRRSLGETLIPQGVAFKRNQPDPDGGPQIVYLADDEQDEVVIKAYVDPGDEPVFVRRWELMYRKSGQKR